MTCLLAIPARWGSTRLPGKPLHPICGRTLLARTCDAVRRAAVAVPDSIVVVATDDQRVVAAARDLGVQAVLTAPELSSGSARVLAAAKSLPVPPKVVVNIQGDAPFFPTAALPSLIKAVTAGASVATPIVRLTWAELDALRAHKVAAPFSGTTCVTDDYGDACWFSKQIIPAIRDEERRRATEPVSPIFRHIGLYAYTLDALSRFEQAAPTRLEMLEGLEQLRFFSLGIPLHTVEIASPAISMGGIDTVEDVALAEQLLATYGDPFGT